MDVEVHYKHNLKALRSGMLKLIQHTVHGNYLEWLVYILINKHVWVYQYTD